MEHQTLAFHSSGRIIDISNAKNGLDCDCVCKNCGERLIARQGPKIASCFAHESRVNCAGAIESAVHLAAKQVIAEYKKIAVIPYLISFAKVNPKLDPYIPLEITVKVSQTIEQCARSQLNLTDINLELPIPEYQIKPDIFCYIDETKEPIIIEIAFKHFSDDIKREKLKNYGVGTLEIDLSKLVEHGSLNLQDIKSLIVDGHQVGKTTISQEWIVKPTYIKEAHLITEVLKKSLKDASNQLAEEELRLFRDSLKKQNEEKKASIYEQRRKEGVLFGNVSFSEIIEVCREKITSEVIPDSCYWERDTDYSMKFDQFSISRAVSNNKVVYTLWNNKCSLVRFDLQATD